MGWDGGWDGVAFTSLILKENYPLSGYATCLWNKFISAFDTFRLDCHWQSFIFMAYISKKDSKK
jgi:hypothetical protein